MEKLIGAVCECGMVFLPPRERCVKCSSHTGPIEINDVGNVLTYTVLHVVPDGFDPPLILGLIQLDGVGEVERESGWKVEGDEEIMGGMQGERESRWTVTTTVA